MRNINPPRVVSLEDALRNLAARLTGQPVAELPQSQEGIVQYLAENLPSIDALIQAAVERIQAIAEEPTGQEAQADQEATEEKSKNSHTTKQKE